MLVADVHEDAIKKRQDSLLRSDGNAVLRSERGEADGFQRNGLAAGVGAADDENFFLAAERKSHGNDGARFALELVFKDGMAGRDKLKLAGRREFGKSGVEIASEPSASKDCVERGDEVGGSDKGSAQSLNAIGEVAKDAQDFGGFVFGELNELIVGFDGFERLEENGLAGAAGAVDDAGYAAPLFGANRDDEAIVAKSDVVFGSFGVAGAKNLLERFLDGIARLDNAGADAAERGRSVVANFGIGKDAAANGCEKIAKVGNGCSLDGEQGEFVSVFAELSAEPSGGFEERSDFEKFGCFEDRAGTFELGEPRLRIGEAGETEFATGAEPFARFTDQREFGFEGGTVVAEFESVEEAAAGSARCAETQQVQELFEFEDVGGGLGHGERIRII